MWPERRVPAGVVLLRSSRMLRRLARRLLRVSPVRVASAHKMPFLQRSGTFISSTLRLLARPVPGRHGLGGAGSTPSNFIRSSAIATTQFTRRLFSWIWLRLAEGRPEKESGSFNTSTLPAVLAPAAAAAGAGHRRRVVGQTRRLFGKGVLRPRDDGRVHVGPADLRVFLYSLRRRRLVGRKTRELDTCGAAAIASNLLVTHMRFGFL